ncbi:hypothetical protein BAOM_3010 [Peribacillus asahii]|uniref:Uncharacterized protein n=1 Tax=Peribacillus asahii TaxID=228899 RepID=A0A3Q9RP41_9BACI|nr:hypothetical protein [Peribacillus asahii]AZV43619.1 hypothetical protein BAOM_3010 [Peribacillus asahii]
MTIVESEMRKERLLYILKNSLTWSSSIINSFDDASLNHIYQLLLDQQKLYKVKLSENSVFSLRLTLPSKLAKEHGVTYGDRFNIKFNVDKKEVYLDFVHNGKCKIDKNRLIVMPYSLVERNVLKRNDDTLLYYKDGRITIKSFSFMQ